MAIPLWSSNFPSKSLFYRNASTVEMTWGYSLQHDLNSIRAEHLNHQWETGYIREYIYKRNLCSYLKKEEPEFFMCWHGKYFFFFAGIFLREKSNGQNVSYANIFIKKRKEWICLICPRHLCKDMPLTNWWPQREEDARVLAQILVSTAHLPWTWDLPEGQELTVFLLGGESMMRRTEKSLPACPHESCVLSLMDRIFKAEFWESYFGMFTWIIVTSFHWESYTWEREWSTSISGPQSIQTSRCEHLCPGGLRRCSSLRNLGFGWIPDLI